MKKMLLFLVILLKTQSVCSKEYSFNINKFRKNLKKPTAGIEVSYRNHLGEGRGFFNSLPRYNPHKVNCTTWWQQLIAESYSNNQSELLDILDQIRYFEGTPGFGMRKHFIDHHLLYDSGPLQSVSESLNENCRESNLHKVKIDFGLFKKSSGYSCPIAMEEISDITFNFLPPKMAIRCMDTLSNGVYLAFPVASKRYLGIWGKKSGPMGLVHGLIINKENNIPMLYHASIDRGRVAKELFSSYVLAPGSRLFKGYKIYKLKDRFVPKHFKIKNKKEILSCEQSLIKKNYANSFEDGFQEEHKSHH